MEEEEAKTTGIPELANGMGTPQYPSASSVPENMRWIRMAPSDNSLQESGDGFCEMHEDHNQTIPKVLWGAPRKEKGDSPKADPNSSDKRGPEPDASLPSIPSIPRSGTKAAVAQNNRKKSKEKKGRKKLEEDLLPGENSAVNLPPRPKSKQRILEDVEQEKSRAQISLDNRLVEELNSLHLHQGEVEDICALAQTSGNTHEFLKGVCSSLEKFRSLTRSNLPGSMVESGEVMKSLMDSLSCLGEIKDEIEKQEMEDPKKENGGDCSKDMELRSQPLEKRVAMERAHNLWRNNRLTTQRLFHIYCCYQEQDFVSHRDQLGKLDKCNNLSGLRQTLNLTTNLDYQSSLKGGLSSIMTLGKKEETSGPESSQECHLSELLMGDERSVRSAEPVEQSFSFPTSMGYQTLPLTGGLEPLGFAQATKCLEAAALFIIRSMLMEFGNRPECKISDHQDLRGCSKDVEKGEREVAGKEKMLEKGNATEGDKKPELETVDAVEEDAPEPVVLEKSDFEENEKGKKEMTSADPDQNAADIPPPNMSEDFKEDPINPSSKEAPLSKQDGKGRTQNRKMRKPKSGFSSTKARQQTPEPISTVPNVTDLETSRATDEKNTGMKTARDSDIQTTGALLIKKLLLNEKTENDISEKNVCSQKTLAPEHALQGSDGDSFSEKNRDEKEDMLQTEDLFAQNTLREDQDAAGDDDDDDDNDDDDDVARLVEAEQNHLLEPESTVQNAQQDDDLTQNLDGTVVDHNPDLNRTHEDAFDFMQKRMTAREQETYPAATKEVRKHHSLEFQTAFDKKEGTPTAAPAGLTRALARKNPAHGKLLNILTAGQLLPLPKDENDYMPRKPSRVDIQGAVVVMLTNSDTASGGGSGGKGQGDNSVNSGSKGGDGSGQSRGGARPKTTRTGSNGGGGRDDEDEDRRPPKRNLPLDLPLGSDIASVENPKGQGVVPPDNFKRHRKKQHGAISNEELCQCLGQAGSGIEILRQSGRAGELNRCLLLCLHETSRVTSPSPEDLTCCTCAILHSLLSHFTNSAHDSGECSMCQQLFTLVQFHVLECLAWRREGEEEEEDLSLNICHKMRQAGLFAEEGVTSASPRVWMKVRKYLSAALGPVILLDITTQGGEFGQLELHERTEPLPHTTNSTTMDPHPHPLPSPRTKSAPEQFPLEGHTQNGAAVAASTSLSHTASEFSQAIMPKPSQGPQLRRRLSTKVILQRTIPEEPPSPSASSVPPATPVTETEEDVFKEESVKMKVETIVTLPSHFPQRAPETPDEQEDIMAIIRSYAKGRKEEASRKYSDDPYATQRVYGGMGTISMPEMQNRLIRVEQNLSVEMKPTGVPGIGEVVYGTRQQLLLVARNWAQERDECKASGKCRYQHREEGVILHPFKKKLKILHTRYQKHMQWERLIHLGNGVTGKCHLCIDRTTDFKFCCKKMHILQYEDQELEIWSELSHPHIVDFYGAIRHGEKIYLFAEFIDGGSLAALVKEQWTVGKRLSHWMALNYFRQLLHVLTYLESMGVLHEDIKGGHVCCCRSLFLVFGIGIDNGIVWSCEITLMEIGVAFSLGKASCQCLTVWCYPFFFLFFLRVCSHVSKPETFAVNLGSLSCACVHTGVLRH
ncbi:uncharacterized protein [Littorina saxatilis]|uniref:uncharacterized protein n=1 Tax=Littorina saxatilis TaxID=31220 RepID=UPI0038B4FDF8